MNINNIILNGCSFVHGFDLCFEKFNISDQGNFSSTAESRMTNEQLTEFNKLRLSGQLEKLLHCKVTNISISGECNEYIANSTIRYIDNNKNFLNPETTLVVIGWTEPQRIPFYLTDERLIVCLSSVKNIIEQLKNSYRWISNVSKIVNSYEQFLPLQQLWHDNETMSYTTYIRHMSLVFMLEQYLKNQKIKYCFFNSLPSWPLKSEYLFKLNRHEKYDDLIDWNCWYPNKSIASYDWNWDDEIQCRSLGKTATNHPSIEAVDVFSKELAGFIRNNY